MSFFKKAGNVGSIFKKQVLPNVQGFFKKGGGGRQFSKMAGEASGVTGMVGRELRRGSQNAALEQIGNMTVGADKTRQLRAGALAGSGLLKGASGILQGASDLTNRKNHRGNAGQVALNVLERSKNLKQDTQSMFK